MMVLFYVANANMVCYTCNFYVCSYLSKCFALSVYGDEYQHLVCVR